MADLFDPQSPPPLPARMSLEWQAAINALAAGSLEHLANRRDEAAEILRQVLPALEADTVPPALEAIRSAARDLVAAPPLDPDHWRLHWRACNAARDVLRLRMLMAWASLKSQPEEDAP